MKSTESTRWRVLFVALVAAILGCEQNAGGPDLVEVSGTVTYQGKPLVGATLTMIGMAGHLSTGSTDSDGKFKMTTGGRSGAPVGKLKVGIVKVAAPATKIDFANMKPEDMQKLQIAGGGEAKELASKSEIPEKYAHPDRSGLAAEVVVDASKNVFTYDLVD